MVNEVLVKSWNNVFSKNVSTSRQIDLSKKGLQIGNSNSLSDCAIPLGEKLCYEDKNIDDNQNTYISSSLTINEYILKYQYFPNGIPGIASATIGGCVAVDTHGKDSYQGSNFASNIEALELVTSQKSILKINKDKDFELFSSTIGGYGLTGVIKKIKFKKSSKFFS